MLLGQTYENDEHSNDLVTFSYVCPNNILLVRTSFFHVCDDGRFKHHFMHVLFDSFAVLPFAKGNVQTAPTQVPVIQCFYSQPNYRLGHPKSYIFVLLNKRIKEFEKLFNLVSITEAPLSFSRTHLQTCIRLHTLPQRSDKCLLSSRNIGQLSPKISCFHYLEIQLAADGKNGKNKGRRTSMS